MPSPLSLRKNRHRLPRLPSGKKFPPLLALTEENFLPRPWEHLPRYPTQSAILYRHYTLPYPDEGFARLAHRARQTAIPLLAGWRRYLPPAHLIQGIHIPEHALPKLTFLRRRYPRHVFSAAAHGFQSFRRAGMHPPDIWLVSPVFVTRSHPDARSLGILRFTVLCRKATAPVYALGGIAPANGNRLKRSGYAGMAGISQFW
jgi:thiamine-phosphate pyrophosphorylase